MVALLERVAPYPRPQEDGDRPSAYSSMIAEAVTRQISSARLPESLSAVAHAQFEGRDGGATVFGLLSLYAYESAGGDVITDAISAAVAVELIAAAASVLDDLQDLDPVKGLDRDVPGSGAELVALLMSLSQRALAGVESGPVACARILAAQSLLADFEVKALAGQHQANDRSSSSSAPLADAADDTRAKSGMFGRLAAEVGAALATDSRSVIEMHGDFGEHVAIVDQLQNDVAGVWPGGEASTDIELGRRTPPLVFALEVPSGVSRAADEVKEALRERDEGGKRDEEQLRNALFRSGAVHYAWIVAAVHRAKAGTVAKRCKTANRGSRIGDLLVVEA